LQNGILCFVAYGASRNIGTKSLSTQLLTTLHNCKCTIIIKLIVTSLYVTIVSYCDCAVSLSYVAQGEEQT